MLKKYTSKSSISLSVLMETGKSVHVSFDSLTGGGSVFYTEDEELQKALAKHPKFGRLFKEVADSANIADNANNANNADRANNDSALGADGQPQGVGNTPAGGIGRHLGNHKGLPQRTAPTDAPVDEETDEVEDNETEGETSEEVDGNLKQVHVTDLEDAKNYLADTFGVSRTKIRSKKAIVEVGEENGVVFVGL